MEVDFNQYRTYQILEKNHQLPEDANPVYSQHINQAIEQEMSDLDFKIDQYPDLLVHWFMKVEQDEGIDISQYYYSRWMGQRDMDIPEYKTGTLVVEVIDRKTEQIIWYGSVSDTIYDDMPGVETKINNAVSALFDLFAEDTHLLSPVASN